MNQPSASQISATLRATYSGTPFDLANPDPESVVPLDIVVTLSRMERWSCHCRTTYTVGQHSILASYLVPPRFALAALLHDATETYTGDINRPLRFLLGPVFERIEATIAWAICQRFSLETLMPPEVRAVDERLLATERRDLLAPNDVLCYAEPYTMSIFPWGRRATLRAFVNRFEELTGQRELIDRRLLPLKRKHMLGRLPMLAA